MDKIKTILDRKQLCSEYIRSKQDFTKVTIGAKGLSKPYWKTNWFYGTVGVATIAVIVVVVALNNGGIPEEKTQEPTAKSGQIVAVTEVPNEENEVDLVVESDVVDSSETIDKSLPKPVSEKVQAPVSKEEVVEEVPEISVVRQSVPEEEAKETAEIGMPNVAGVTSGPISFKDFCDPMGIQVGNGVLIYQYTIQYRSCARDVTARIRGNRLPVQLCNEIRDCGSAIEVTFSNFAAEDREGNIVELKPFTLVTSPR